MKSEHTPGPWAAPFSRESYAGHALIAIEGDPGQHVSYAIYPQAKSEGEVQANACLIAAAPCLLEALEHIEKQASDLLNSRPDVARDWQSLHNAVAEAQKAISQAKGHQQ